VKKLPEIKSIQNEILAKLLPNVTIVGNSARLLFQTPSSLRLTKKGVNLLKKKCRSWTVETPGKLAGNLMDLQSKMKHPYYIDKKDMVLFSEKDAFMARLAGTEGWLKGKG
jgi:hypothetical protein|tara:strand:+ start:7874 stop:8206 length:333 start_codon:yes stop_codon:yes gene_type:complete